VELSVDDNVARTCKGSTVDSTTGKPTPASFAFRKDEGGSWKDDYLSVNRLELLAAADASMAAKIAAIRAYLLSENPPYPVFKPTKTSVFAVLPVRSIHEGQAGDIPVILRCLTEAQGEGDPHAGIHPDPGVEEWKPDETGDEPEHLAVQLFLFECMSYSERAIPPK